MRRGAIAAVIVVLCIAWAMRVIALDTLPPGIDRDTATNGVYTLWILKEGLRPLFYRMGAPEPLIVYLQSLSVALLGVSTFALRIVTAMVGALTVAALYVVVRGARFGPRVAALAAFGLAVCVEDIHLSRLGLRAILLPLCEMLLLYLVWRAWRTGRMRDFLAAGAVLGISYYTYISAIFLPLIPAAFIAHQLVFERARLGERTRGIAAGGGLALAIAAPLLIFEIVYPQAAFFRASQVTLFQHPAYNQVGLLGVLGLKAISQLKMFGLEWEGQYNPLSQPLLDPLWFAVFVIGLFLCFRRVKRIEYAWAPGLIALMLLPDLIGGNEVFPQELRVIGIIPPVFFVGAIGLTGAADLAGKRRRWLSGVFVALFVAISLANSYEQYFIRFPTISASTNDINFNRIEVAEGEWIARAREPVLMPLNEYARQPVRYLAGKQAPRIASALDANGALKPNLVSGSGLALFPVDPRRVRFEGRAYSDDPSAFVLVRDGTAYLLPPVAPLDKSGMVQQVSYGLGQAANVYRVDLGTLKFAKMPLSSPIQLDSGVTLVAFDQGVTRVQPGESISVTLWWQVARRMANDEIIFVHLLDVNNDVAANLNVLPGLGAYPTLIWKPNEIIATHHLLQVPARTRPGKYSIEIGMYNVLNENRLNVLGAHGKPVDSRAIIGTVKIAPRQAMVYNPTHIQGANFANQIGLMGYDLAPTDAPRQFRVSLYSRALDEMQTDYTLFLHVLDTNGKIVAQSDHQPQDGNYPTSIWGVGESVRDDSILEIPTDAPPGRYEIEMGWYDLKTGARLSGANGDHILLDTPLEVNR